LFHRTARSSAAKRDTTDRDGGTPAFTADAWRAFMADVKRS
jgi:hypothetical protein